MRTSAPAGTSPKHCTRVLAIAGGALLVAACGSSGSDPPPDTDRDGFASSTDCNDNDAAAWQTLGLFADTDRDGVGAGQTVNVCAGTGTPVGYSRTSTDCAADDASIHTSMAYAGRDADGDSVLVASAGSVCGNGATLPATYFANAASGDADCDDQNKSIWRVSLLHEDFDRDGVGHGPALSVCMGNVEPPGFAASSFDCDALSPTKWRMVVTYADVDGDGVGSGPFQPLCVGLGPPPGSSFLGFDPLDTLTDPSSALVSDFDLNLPSLIVDSDGEEDDILF